MLFSPGITKTCSQPIQVAASKKQAYTWMLNSSGYITTSHSSSDLLNSPFKPFSTYTHSVSPQRKPDRTSYLSPCLPQAIAYRKQTLLSTVFIAIGFCASVDLEKRAVPYRSMVMAYFGMYNVYCLSYRTDKYIVMVILSI